MEPSNNLLKSILESSSENIIFALDYNYCYITFNENHRQTMKNIWNVNIQVGDNKLDVIKYREDRNKAKANFDRVLDGENFTVVEQYGDESINRNWYQADYSPLYDDSSNVIGLTVFSTDITERKQIEEELKESRKQLEEQKNILEAILNNVPIGIWLVDQKQNPIIVNDYFINRTGFGTEKCSMTEEEIINCKKTDEDAYQKEKPQKYEEKMTFKDGHQHILETIKRKLVNQDGDFLGILGIGVDITERKQAEKALKESEEKFRAYVDNAPVGIIVVNEEGQLIDVNPQACKMRGYKKEELLNKEIKDVVHPDYRQKAFENLKLVKETGSSDDVLLGVRKDGSTFFYEFYFVKISDDLYMSFQIDVTERIEKEIQIKKSEEKFRTLFEENMLAIYLHDFDGKILDVNTEASSQLGYSREELLNMSVFDFIYTKDVGGHSSKQELLNLWNQMEIGKRTRLEGMFQRQDGSVMYAEVSTGLVRYNNREMIMALASDITKRKQAEKQLQDSYKEIEIKQSQIDAELEKAKEIHEKTLLGKFSKTGSPEDISLEAHYYPTKQIGGDFYNFIRVENKLIIYLSDVTGHGIEAAIISSFVKDTIANYADLETGELTPEKMLTHVHKHYINNDFPEDYFVCLYVAVLDLDTYELTYSAAGMQFPLFVKLADGNCINLQSEGPPISNLIGLELMDFRADSITLTPGSIVLFYTDGIAEQMNEDNNPYEERLKNTFYSQQSKFPPKLIKQVINTDFVDFNGSLQGDDDITYVILQINPPERKQYYWELYSTTQEIENFYSEVFPVISEYINEETTIKCLYELVVNAMEHGNKFDSKKKVYVQVVLTNDYVFATVEDEGDGFNWREKVAGKSQDIIDSEKERGRGILMASSLCDRLFYNEKSNKAFLILESNI